MLTCKKDRSLVDVIQNKLEEGHEVRPFPGSVNQLLTAIKKPSSNSGTFAQIIEQDAALSTRILRMVNSPLYGFSNEVVSISHAVTVLGQNPLKNIALSYAGASIITGNSKSKGQYEALWSHSLGCATVARMLANLTTGICPDESFLTGIFHDIGKLFFLDTVPKEYSSLAASCFGTELLAQENELFGTNHAEVGLQLTITWPLSDGIKGAIRYHHEPESESQENSLTTLIHVADSLARSVGIGSSTTRQDSDDVLERANKYLGLDESALESVAVESLNEFNKTKQAFSS